MNPIVHFEIGARDKQKTSRFYGNLFDWRVEERLHGISLRTGDDVGGHIDEVTEPYVLFYVGVQSLEESIAKAESLGGKCLTGPSEVPEAGGRYAWLKDPDGNTIGLYQGAEQEKS